MIRPLSTCVDDDSHRLRAVSFENVDVGGAVVRAFLAFSRLSISIIRWLVSLLV